MVSHPMWVTRHRPAPGGDKQAATHNCAHSRVSLTQKQPWAVARSAWPHHKQIQKTTHTTGPTSEIPLASVCTELFGGNNFLEFSRMFMKLSEY